MRLAPLNRIKPSSKYFTDRSKAVLLLWIFYVFVQSCVCYVFVRVCLYVLCGHLLGKGWPLGSRLWCLLWVFHFPIGILGQVWYLIVSIPDLCTLTYFVSELFISSSTENNRLTLTSKWKLVSIMRQFLSSMLSCHECTLLLYLCV